jgi:hypothetical protein
MQDASTIWLTETLLLGEAYAWQAIATSGTAHGLPAELVALATGTGTPAEWDAASAALRRYAVAAPDATASLVIASATMLRISALGRDDSNWSPLIPRWLVPGLDARTRGLGLLALAVHARERLAADDYAAIVEEALPLLPVESPLHASSIHQFALYLGLRGMLHRLDPLIDLPSPGDIEPDVEPGLLAECFYDAVCCGRTAQAAFLSALIDSTPEVAWQLGLVHLHRIYLPVFAAVLGKRPIPTEAEAPSAPLLRALVEDDAVFLNDYDVSNGRGELSPLVGYDGLRVALVRRDQSAARRLLDERASGPERHWLDDFFLARLLLQEDQRGDAGAAFARVEAAAQRYGATERLEIELRLATELTRHDCCILGMAAGCKPVRPWPAAQPATGATSILAGPGRHAAALRESLRTTLAALPPHVLVVGPADGSTRTLSGLLSAGFGDEAMCRISAAGSAQDDWLGRCLDQARLAAKKPRGCQVIGDIELLDPSAQSRLLDALDTGWPCRLICTASSGLVEAVEAGHWRQDLYWTLSTHRLHVPGIELRSVDLGDMASGLLLAFGSNAHLEQPAIQSLIAEPLPGGWAQLQALCRVLATRIPAGTIDARTIMLVAASLRFAQTVDG